MQNDKKFNTINIDELIKQLETFKNKGIKQIKLNGTLLVNDNSNSIISSTEKQF